MIADQSGTTVWRNDNTEPFGDSVPNGDPNNTGVVFDFPLRFPGQYFDKETNLSYNYFRDYDPSIGRYVESDPLGVDAGLNTYLYVKGSPVSLSDPMGLAPQLDLGCYVGCMMFASVGCVAQAGIVCGLVCKANVPCLFRCVGLVTGGCLALAHAGCKAFCTCDPATCQGACGKFPRCNPRACLGSTTQS